MAAGETSPAPLTTQISAYRKEAVTRIICQECGTERDSSRDSCPKCDTTYLVIGRVRWRIRSVLRTILLVAFALRASVAGLALARHTTDAPDSESYLTPAHALIAWGRFERHGAPELIRTPGYPVLVAIGDAVGHTRAVTLSFQVALGVFTVWLVWVLARTAGLGESVALGAAALYCVEPLAVVFTARLLTETLFTCVVVALSLTLTRWAGGGKRTDLVAAGALLALGALVRPVLYYAPPVVTVVIIVMQLRRGSWRRAIVDGLLVFGVAAVPIAAWRARNASVAGYDGFSGVTDLSLRFYLAAGVVARRTHTTREAVQAAWGANSLFDSLTATEYYARGRELGQRLKGFRAAALPIVMHDPVSVAKDAARGGLMTLLGPGPAEWQNVLGLPRGRHLVLTTCLTALLALFWGLVALGVWRGWNELGALVPAFVLAAYLVGISALPEGYSRFRHPVMPVLCLVGARGFVRRRASATGTEVERPAP
jgi:4-amino-4-deoxy-L-arabinose transferase-like glycosyltransferase